MVNNVLSVANAFIDLAKQEGQPISNMKLQKLLYFAQGHSFGLRNRPLVDEAPEAWRHGPVFPSVYHEFKHYGADDIDVPAMVYDWNDGCYVPPPPIHSMDDQNLIRAVWDAYKNRSPVELSNMSHIDNGPWARVYGTYRNADIRESDMREFFRTGN